MQERRFNEARQFLVDNGFYLIKHPVVIHHLLKDFSDYEVYQYRFYIKPTGADFVHVALIETRNEDVIHSWDPEIIFPSFSLQVRYTCAADDLLYGLRVKFNNGGSKDPFEDIAEIQELIKSIKKDRLSPDVHYAAIRNHPRYVRSRFKHGRFKAKLRATIIMLKDKWRQSK